MRPRLPKAESLLPYLRRIDESRIYGNWGPLTAEFSSRLESCLGIPRDRVVCASSGMAALCGAIFAHAGQATPSRPIALVPDNTFSATALAPQLCGYEVTLVTCDPDTWALDPDRLLDHPKALDRVGLVVPVAPYGRSLDLAAWRRFQARTGIPVVVDAAASFDTWSALDNGGHDELVVVLSFHATKSLGIGEGGAVVTCSQAMRDRVVRCLNFGFFEDRLTTAASLNGKLSEYAAAVGLAALDAWPRMRAASARVAKRYGHAFDSLPRVPAKLWMSPDISSCYVLAQCGSRDTADLLSSALDANGIGTRRWYGQGIGSHPHFSRCARLDLHHGKGFDAASLLGLPCAPDLPSATIDRIVDSVGQALAPRHPARRLA